MRRTLSSYHPALYHLRVWQKQLVRRAYWHIGRQDFATTRAQDLLPHKIYRHQSKLHRYLSDDPQDRLWQDNKVHNHALALPHLNKILIKPGEVFSFWRLVGRPSAKRGYREGMELSRGRAQGGIGGGVCQIGNLLHWIALHSPLKVTARANHSFDPFPDQGRVIPYGTGAALFYNYIDLWIENPTDEVFQFHLWMTDKHLKGELRAMAPWPVKFHVYERAAGFRKSGTAWQRHNEIWRKTRAKDKANTVLRDEFLYANNVRAMYEPAR